MCKEAGFTIVEALTAIAVLAVVLVTLYGAGADALKASNHIAKADRAALFAQSKLESLSLIQIPLPLRDGGTTEGFQWSVTARPSPASLSPWNTRMLQTVRLDVTWQGGINMRSLTVETRHLGVANR